MPRQSATDERTDEMTPGAGSLLDLVLEVWSRRKWMGLAVFVVVVTAAVSVANFLPSLYRSTATVLIERHLISETFVRPSVTGEVETRLQTISQQILSRARLEALITRLDLYPELKTRTPMPAVVEKMRRDIQLELKAVEQGGGRGATVAFTLSYRGRDPETVARVTNILASFYVEENSRTRERQATGTAQFLKAQLDETKRRLDDQEARVRAFRLRHVGELPQQMAVNLATLERLHAQLHLASANQLRAMDRRAALLKEMAELNTDTGRSEAATNKLGLLKQELIELRRQFSDKYPDVVRVKREIAALEHQLAEAPFDAAPRPTAPPDPAVLPLRAALRDIDAEIEALHADEERIRRDIATYQRRVENAPQREDEYQELARDYGMTKDLYASLLKRYEDAQLAESMEQRQQGEQFRILDPALPAMKPAAPNRLGLMIVGAVLAFAMAAAVVVLTEHFDTSFHSVDRLREHTNVAVLVSIPLIVTRADRRRRRWRSCVAAVVVLLALAFIVQGAAMVATGNEPLVTMLARKGS